MMSTYVHCDVRCLDYERLLEGKGLGRKCLGLTGIERNTVVYSMCNQQLTVCNIRLISFGPVGLGVRDGLGS